MIRIHLFDDGGQISEAVMRNWASLNGEYSHIELQRNPTIHALTLEPPNLVVLVSDSSPQTIQQNILSECRQHEISTLSVVGFASTAIIGPLEIPGKQGCSTCLQLRLNNSPHKVNLNRIVLQELGRGDVNIALSLTANELNALGELVVAQLSTIQSDLNPLASGHVCVCRRSGEIEWVTLVPSDDCPRCSHRIIAGTVRGTVGFKSREVKDMELLRVRQVDHEVIHRLYVHPDVGYVSDVRIEKISSDGYVGATARISAPTMERTFFGYGTGVSDTDAQRTAILEVIERASVCVRSRDIPLVFAAYNTLKGRALNPLKLGLHSESRYDVKNEHWESFHEDTNYSWVWGYSTQNDRPILVPEQAVRGRASLDSSRFILETSNGCAIGTTVEEAILYGVFEVLERDAALNMWYGEMPVPELKLSGDVPESIRVHLEFLKQRRYRVCLFNISHDLTIPIVLALAENTENRAPMICVGSACHIHPVRAVTSALREVAIQVFNVESLSEEKIGFGHSLIKDPSKIRNISHHVLAAAMPEARPRWEFLLKASGREPLVLEEAYPNVQSRFQVQTRDMEIILETVLEDLHLRGFDVIVTDQTNTEAAYGGFHVVKVIIPGMTPLTFGYGNDRLEGLTRVYDLPYRMGYRSHVLTARELNPYCHPIA